MISEIEHEISIGLGTLTDTFCGKIPWGERLKNSLDGRAVRTYEQKRLISEGWESRNA